MEKLGIESKSLLCLDVPTRWNSTYLMLETDKNFEKVFVLDFEDNNYLSYFMNKENNNGLGSPIGIDFQNHRTFVGFFKSFFIMQQRSSLVLCMLF